MVPDARYGTECTQSGELGTRGGVKYGQEFGAEIPECVCRTGGRRA